MQTEERRAVYEENNLGDAQNQPTRASFSSRENCAVRRDHLLFVCTVRVVFSQSTWARCFMCTRNINLNIHLKLVILCTGKGVLLVSRASRCTVFPRPATLSQFKSKYTRRQPNCEPFMLADSRFEFSFYPNSRCKLKGIRATRVADLLQAHRAILQVRAKLLASSL